jgi:cellulose synthase/poly-beta-1,6-N-acetylglucosamine synthase-like glycosyltransferase
MAFALTALSFLALVRTAVVLISTIFTIRFVSPTKEELGRRAMGARTADIILVLPVLRETETIEASLEFLEQARSTGRVLECLIVGSARERNGAGQNGTLLRARRHLSAVDNFIRVLEAPESEDGKARQINYGLGDLLERHGNRQIWILMLDADSRFSWDVLHLVEPASAAQTPVVQMHSLFLAGFRDLPLVQKAHAIYQSRWTISHEIPNNYASHRTGWFVSHIVGHGAFVKMPLLVALGGMPTSTHTEDLHLGFYIVATGARIKSLPLLEMSETPDTFKEALKQQKNWAFGPLFYPRYLLAFSKDLRLLYEANRMRSVVISVLGAYTFLEWLLLFPVLGMVALWAAAGNGYAQAALALYYTDLTLVSFYFVRGGWVPRSYVLFGPPLMVGHTPIRSLAAWRALFQVVTRRDIRRSKTVNRQRAKGR